MNKKVRGSKAEWPPGFKSFWGFAGQDQESQLTLKLRETKVTVT